MRVSVRSLIDALNYYPKGHQPSTETLILISPKDPYRITVYYQSVDTTMAEILSRFGENDRHILCALADVMFSSDPKTESY